MNYQKEELARLHWIPGRDSANKKLCTLCCFYSTPIFFFFFVKGFSFICHAGSYIRLAMVAYLKLKFSENKTNFFFFFWRNTSQCMCFMSTYLRPEHWKLETFSELNYKEDLNWENLSTDSMQSSPNSLQTFFEETVKKFINIYQKGRHRTDETILKIEQRKCVIHNFKYLY